MIDRFKFRVWDKTQKQFIKDDYRDKYVLGMDGKLYNDYKSGYCSSCQELEIVKNEDNFIIQQSIGLQDKNGKPIYEGDILKYKIPRHDGDYTGIGEVKYINGCFIVYDVYLMPEINSAFMEIIGNKFEHSELLKETKK
jgi:uncharacterized phage protein (TIGR01671 family)